jgi:hypothetical protein
MRTKLIGIVVAVALSAIGAQAAAQTCTLQSKPGNLNAYNAGLNDYLCSYYSPSGVGSYCDTAKTYAAAANVPVFAPGHTTCATAALYNYYCRYYEYNGYGWNYSGYCTSANTYAQSGNCCPVADAPQYAPELDRVYLLYNYATGDMAPGWCDSLSGYSLISAFQVYRGATVNKDTPGTLSGLPWANHPIYQCTRTVSVYNQNGAYYNKTDLFLTRESNCNGYGTMIQQMGYALDAASEGSENSRALSCWYNATPQNGGNPWWEIRVEFATSCSSGYAPISDLGYIRFSSGGSEGEMSNGPDTCDAAHCYGECGKDCNGLIGTHITTSACYAHDLCVCQHNNDLLDPACYGKFILAAASWVVAAAVKLLRSIVNFVKHVLHFLCFWC